MPPPAKCCIPGAAALPPLFPPPLWWTMPVSRCCSSAHCQLCSLSHRCLSNGATRRWCMRVL